jgi:DNA-binding NarL/FixJ family response regulator
MADRARISVLIADDHELVRAGLRMVIDASNEFEVVGEANDGLQVLDQVRLLLPSIVLLDLTMPRAGGLQAAAMIRNESPASRVIILSMHASEQYVSAALRAGVAGYLVKGAAVDELLEGLRTVAAGQRYFSPQVASQALESYTRSLRGTPQPGDELSPRQRQILQLIAEGRSTREIGELLAISAKTVETHRAELMRRLSIYDVAGLTRYAVRVGLVSAEN